MAGFPRPRACQQFASRLSVPRAGADGCIAWKSLYEAPQPFGTIFEPMILVASILSRLIVRAALAVLLLVAASAPAVAELGCVGDSLAESRPTSATAPSAISLITGEQPGEQKQTPGGGASHCAFSHCSHAFPMSAAADESVRPDARLTQFALNSAARLPAAPRDGPERPPQA